MQYAVWLPVYPTDWLGGRYSWSQADSRCTNTFWALCRICSMRLSGFALFCHRLLLPYSGSQNPNHPLWMLQICTVIQNNIPYSIEVSILRRIWTGDEWPNGISDGLHKCHMSSAPSSYQCCSNFQFNHLATHEFSRDIHLALQLVDAYHIQLRVRYEAELTQTLYAFVFAFNQAHKFVCNLMDEHTVFNPFRSPSTCLLT